MARQARLIIPQNAHFVKQIGHNNQIICESSEDAKRLRAIISETLPLFDLSLHAFLITPTELELLVTPQNETAISGWVQAIGRKYVPYFNQKHQRSGALWNGRYLCTVIDLANHGLDIVQYMNEKANLACEQMQIDNAVLSASAHYLGQLEIRWLQPIKEWWLLGNTPFDREKAYAEKLNMGLGSIKTQYLDAVLGRDKVLGSEAFVHQLERLTGQKLRRGKAGRPARTQPNNV